MVFRPLGVPEIFSGSPKASRKCSPFAVLVILALMMQKHWWIKPLCRSVNGDSDPSLRQWPGHTLAVVPVQWVSLLKQEKLNFIKFPSLGTCLFDILCDEIEACIKQSHRLNCHGCRTEKYPCRCLSHKAAASLLEHHFCLKDDSQTVVIQNWEFGKYMLFFIF